MSLLQLGSPDFINDEGFRWYKRELFEPTARECGLCVFLICDCNDNPETYMAIDLETNKPIREEASIEGMGIFLDMIKAKNEIT